MSLIQHVDYSSPRVQHSICLHHSVVGVRPCNVHGGGAHVGKKVWLKEPSQTLCPGISQTVSATTLLQEAGGTVSHPSDVQSMVTKAKLILC